MDTVINNLSLIFKNLYLKIFNMGIAISLKGSDFSMSNIGQVTFTPIKRRLLAQQLTTIIQVLVMSGTRKVYLLL